MVVGGWVVIRELAKMSYYTFQISTTKNVRKLLLTILKDTCMFGVIGYIKSYIYESINENSRLVLQIIGFDKWKSSIMSFYGFQISKSKTSSKLILNREKDAYVICVIGYIKSYMYKYFNGHSRLVLQFIWFLLILQKYNNLQKQLLKKEFFHIIIL